MLSADVHEIINFINEVEQMKLRSNNRQSLRRMGIPFKETETTIVARPYAEGK